MRPRRFPQRGDEGYALLIALVFIGTIAIVISGLLTQSIAQFKAERAFREQREGVFAADAGLEHAIAGVGMTAGTTDPGECTSTEDVAFVGGASATSASANLSVSSFPIADIRGQHGFVVVAASLRSTSSTMQVTLGSFTMRALTPAPTASNGGRSSTTQIFYAFESDLPAGNSATVTLTGAGSVPRVLYVSRWTGVDQAAPGYASSSRASTQDWIETSVSPPAEGALIFSAAASSWDDDSMNGSGAGTRLANVPYNPSGGSNDMQFGASYGIAGDTDAVTVREDFGDNADPATHALLLARAASETGACPGTPTPDRHKEGTPEGFFNTTVTLSAVPIDAPAGRNRLVLVAVHDDDAAASVTFNGHPMDLARRAESGASKTSVWYLLDADLPGPGQYNVTVTSASPLDLFPQFTIHASSWTGVLQGYGPSDDTPNPKSGTISSITTAVNTDTAGSLVFSAAGHENQGTAGMGAVSGATRLTNGPASDGTSFGTAWTVVPEPTTGYEVTEAFSGPGNPTSHVLLAFRPATWSPLEFGAACEDGLGGLEYNGYAVTVACVVSDTNGDGDNDTISAESTATSAAGRAIVGRATITRLSSGTIEITEWDTRPSADP